MTRNCSIRTVAFLFLLIFRPTDGWPQDDLGLMLVLIPAGVQTHPLVGSDAFWMTRPIPPGTRSRLVRLC